MAAFACHRQFRVHICFFFSATQKTNTFKALSLKPSFLNVYYSSAIFKGADPMLFNKALLDKEAKAHGLYIRPSKFKHAGMGLFAAQGPYIAHLRKNRCNSINLFSSQL